MSKTLAYAFTAALLFAPSLAVAQAQVSQMQVSQAEARDLTDIRVDIVKSALQLSPEQAQYWPAIEGAMRARAETRRQKIENVASRMDETRPDRDFVRLLQKRADNLSERGAELRKLADAWQPLSATMTDTQKRRMRILAALVIHEVREDRDVPRIQVDEEQIWGAAVGAGTGESGVGR